MKKDTSVFTELAAGSAGIALLIYLLRSMLLFGDTTFIHDHLYWGYPSFQFYAENIINGQIPLWNPFTHGGETFYPFLVIQKLIDPIPLLTVTVGHFFTNDIVTLYNWNHFIQNIIMVTGIYILFRPVAGNRLIRISLIPILLYSSIIFSSYRQAAGLYHFIWIPYITCLLLRIIYKKDYRWHNWLLLAALIGLNWQSYFFAGTWTFLLFFFLALLLFRRDLLTDLFKSRGLIPRVSVTIAIVCTMMLPNIAILSEKGSYVYPARLIDSDSASDLPMGGPQQFEGHSTPKEHGIIMPYKLIAQTGTFSKIWDLLQTVLPEGNRYIQPPGSEKTWGNASEAYMYIGLLPWVIALLGIFSGRHEQKKIWLFILISFGLLILGPAGGLHRLLYYIYPPLWFVRHTHGLSLIFLFSVLFFYVLGLNYLYAMWTTGHSHPKTYVGHTTGLSLSNPHTGITVQKAAAFLAFSGSVFIFTGIMTRLEYPNSNYIFLLLLGCFIIGWLLRRHLGPEGIWAGLISSHIFLVLFAGANRSDFLIKIFLLVGIPLIAFRYAINNRTMEYKKYLGLLLLLLFAVSMTVDFKSHIRHISFLYKGQPNPKIAYNLDTSFTDPEPANSRQLVPNTLFGYGTEPQSLRYISILERQPYVFSPIMEKPAFLNNFPAGEEKKTDDFEIALKSKRWNSFLLLKNCFKLLHSSIPPLAMKEMFAVGKPLIQFKHMAINANDDEIIAFLKKLGPDQAVRLLSNSVFINNNKTGSASGKLITTLNKYEKNQQVPFEGFVSNSEHDFNFSFNEYNHNSLNMTVSTEKAGMLYWSDGYDDKWHAYIDGKEVPIYRANINFKAIILPEGTSSIRFTFEHPLFKTALSVYYSTLLLSMLAALITWLYSRNKYCSENQ